MLLIFVGIIHCIILIWFYGLYPLKVGIKFSYFAENCFLYNTERQNASALFHCSKDTSAVTSMFLSKKIMSQTDGGKKYPWFCMHLSLWEPSKYPLMKDPPFDLWEGSRRPSGPSLTYESAVCCHKSQCNVRLHQKKTSTKITGSDSSTLYSTNETTLENCIQFGSPLYKKDAEALERVEKSNKGDKGTGG